VAVSITLWGISTGLNCSKFYEGDEGLALAGPLLLGGVFVGAEDCDAEAGGDEGGGGLRGRGFRDPVADLGCLDDQCVHGGCLLSLNFGRKTAARWERDCLVVDAVRLLGADVEGSAVVGWGDRGDGAEDSGEVLRGLEAATDGDVEHAELR